MTIKEMVERCFSNAEKLGWNEQDSPIPERLMLVVTELAEGMEAYRNNEPVSWTDENGKPQGLASEYADAVIRIGHYCARQKIDLDYEIDRKLTYNLTRGYRHGGKLA